MGWVMSTNNLEALGRPLNNGDLILYRGSAGLKNASFGLVVGSNTIFLNGGIIKNQGCFLIEMPNDNEVKVKEKLIADYNEYTYNSICKKKNNYILGGLYEAQNGSYYLYIGKYNIKMFCEESEYIDKAMINFNKRNKCKKDIFIKFLHGEVKNKEFKKKYSVFTSSDLTNKFNEISGCLLYNGSISSRVILKDGDITFKNFVCKIKVDSFKHYVYSFRKNDFNFKDVILYISLE